MALDNFDINLSISWYCSHIDANVFPVVQYLFMYQILWRYFNRGQAIVID